MKKFSFITVINDGERIHLDNVLIGIVRKEGVALLEVHAEVSENNLFELVRTGVEFIKSESSYIMHFVPMCLESTRK